MSYPESVRYLYALGNELKAGAKFGLERMRTLMNALGNPERGQRFVHVAGTNGKGSTSAMLASVLREADFRTGLYTSPHLVSPVERIQIDGIPVSEDEFARAFERVHSVSEKLVARDEMDAHPSYFETVTAMAFLLFRERCEISVIEVGLGGRLDATNVIAPELCVITPVSFDHEAFLGNTIEAIAAEKAGILKSGVPLVMAAQDAKAEAVITAAAIKETRTTDSPDGGWRSCDSLPPSGPRPAACAAIEVIRSDSVKLEDVVVTAEKSQFSSDGVAFVCPLAGRHQIENARTAIAACRALGMADSVIAAGIEKTKWPGRLELVRRRPNFILDGAHNPAGAASLAAHIREFYSAKPVWIVYGAMRDKAIDEVAGQLFPLAERLILTGMSFARALRPEAILEMFPYGNAVVADGVAAAVKLAERAPVEGSVFFTGSLFLVGEMKGLGGF